ncbi:MAG TPA: hypothetical protein PK777_16660, partial [Thermoguttaceae bacterium]|nr:hypothetical protein [Thermoguttaceae bacterium]
MSSSTSFEFLHWDPDGQLRRFLDRWFPTHRLSLGGQDPYRASYALRPRPTAWKWPKWGQWQEYEGPAILNDGLVSLPQLPWEDRPPQWILNSLWMPTGASRASMGLFLSTQQL